MITIYIREGCYACRILKNMLDEKGIVYEEKTVTDTTIGAPKALINDVIFTGFNNIIKVINEQYYELLKQDIEGR